MAKENKQVNGKAIVILLIGILSILVNEILGVLLGIGAIVLFVIYRKEIGQYQTLGRSIAIIGFVCSIIGIITQSLDIVN